MERLSHLPLLKIYRMLHLCKRRGIDVLLGARACLPAHRSIENLYLPTIQKCGSQWIRQIFSDPWILRQTGLRVFPTRRYDMGEYVRKFPAGTVVPALYINWNLYLNLEKPANHRTLFIYRDPRDIWVSWYFSMRDSHFETGQVSQFRQIFTQVDQDTGLHLALDLLREKLHSILPWLEFSNDDKRISCHRLEDLTVADIVSWQKLMASCRIDMERSQVSTLLDKYSFENMKKEDLKRRKTGDGHYRSGAQGQWRQYLSQDHLEHFRSATGDLIPKLGYEP